MALLDEYTQYPPLELPLQSSPPQCIVFTLAFTRRILFKPASWVVYGREHMAMKEQKAKTWLRSNTVLFAWKQRSPPRHLPKRTENPNKRERKECKGC